MGASKLSWEVEPNATFYVVECSLTPLQEGTWMEVAKPTKTRVTVAGAEAGKPCFFRVQGWNTLGEGPWSDISGRPVL